MPLLTARRCALAALCLPLQKQIRPGLAPVGTIKMQSVVCLSILWVTLAISRAGRKDVKQGWLLAERYQTKMKGGGSPRFSEGGRQRGMLLVVASVVLGKELKQAASSCHQASKFGSTPAQRLCRNTYLLSRPFRMLNLVLIDCIIDFAIFYHTCVPLLFSVFKFSILFLLAALKIFFKVAHKRFSNKI